MEASKGRKVQHHSLHDLAGERRAAVQEDVARARVLVHDYDCKLRVRTLSAKFNTVQEHLTKKGAARTHWLVASKLATGLDTAAHRGVEAARTVAARPDYDEVAKRAYLALEEAQTAPPGQAAKFWLEAEELFFSGLLAMGRSREQVTAEIEAEQAATKKNMTMAILRWRKANTMVLTSVKMMKLVLKTRNFVFKMMNRVSKTRNLYLKMMNFAG